MNHCEDFQALLDLFVDGELAPDEMARVQKHLDTCPACRDYVDGALAIRAAFPSIEDTEVPEGFAEGVMMRIRTSAPKRVTVNFRRRWMGAAAALAACCAVVVLLRSGPVGMNGGLEKNFSPTAANDTAQQTESAYDMYMTGSDKDEAAEDSGMDAGEPVDKLAGESGAENRSVAHTAGALPENAADLEEAGSPAREAGSEAQLRNTPIRDYDVDASKGMETFADLPSSAESAAVGADCAPAEAAGGGAAEDCEEAETPVTSFAPAPEPVPTPAASKTEGPDLVISSSEAGDLLDAFVPAEDRGTERVYLLTREEFAALLEKLPVQYRQECDKETITVLVTAA